MTDVSPCINDELRIGAEQVIHVCKSVDETVSILSYVMSNGRSVYLLSNTERGT
jgi:hypothetical protein